MCNARARKFSNGQMPVCPLPEKNQTGKCPLPVARLFVPVGITTNPVNPSNFGHIYELILETAEFENYRPLRWTQTATVNNTLLQKTL